jgi:hypothetical protein
MTAKDQSAAYCDKQAASCEADPQARQHAQVWRDRANELRREALPFTRAQIKAMAEQAGLDVSLFEMGGGSLVFSPGVQGVCLDELFEFVRIVAQAARESGNA